MNRDNEDRTTDLVEIGSASADTLGNEFYAVEVGGFMPKHGISND